MRQNGGSPDTTATVVREPIAARSIEYALPAVGIGSKFEEVCRDRTAPRDPDASYGLEFESVPLHPLPYGPRIREMPRKGPRRSFSDLYEALSRQARHMNACYRWARDRKRFDYGILDAAITIDPFGMVTSASVSGGCQPPNECIEEGVKAMQVSNRTPRITNARVRIAFEPSGQSGVQTPHARPTKPPPPLPVSPCIHLPTPVPVDMLEARSEDILATFDDWSVEQAEALSRNRRRHRRRRRHLALSAGRAVWRALPERRAMDRQRARHPSGRRSGRPCAEAVGHRSANPRSPDLARVRRQRRCVGRRAEQGHRRPHSVPRAAAGPEARQTLASRLRPCGVRRRVRNQARVATGFVPSNGVLSVGDSVIARANPKLVANQEGSTIEAAARALNYRTARQAARSGTLAPRCIPDTVTRSPPPTRTCPKSYHAK